MDDDTGYELDDPCHPTFHERYAEHADLMRKREKEDGMDFDHITYPNDGDPED
jgi:hypothetical protein